jgi:hypothetical protein
MKLQGLTATPGPEGNRIAIAWTRPDARVLPGVRVVRRPTAFPDTPQPGTAAEGVVIADSDPATTAPASIEALPDGRLRVVDDGLAAETVYYYQVYPYTYQVDADAGPSVRYHEDAANRTSAMATGPYDLASLLYRLLPAIYHRYDTILPADVLDAAQVAAMDPADQQRGQLRRFLELPGGQLDQLYSSVGSLRDLHDLARVDGHLLPLLAHWIGWQTDYGIDLERQRVEIRNAPALYHAIQTVAAVEATVTRVTRWASRSKELVDNVFVANRPERLTLWLAGRVPGDPPWVFCDRPLSLDDAYDGRPVAVTDSKRTMRLLYATQKAGRYDIWQKTHTPSYGWSGSEPVLSRPGVDRDPAAVMLGDTVWLFWAVYDQEAGRWRIDFRTSTESGWSPVATFRDGHADRTERKAPAALVDDADALWLFWLERSGAGWKLRYNRFADTPLTPTPAGSVAFPDDDDADPRVESDVFVLFRPACEGDPRAAFRRLWVLWSRREPVAGEPEQTRWRVVSRFKDGTDPANDDDWGKVSVLTPRDTHDHDREPAAMVAADGNLAAFWSSTRDGSWSVWQAEIDVAAHAWETRAPVTGPPFSERAPLPFRLAGDLVLAYRSNCSLTYPSRVYRATQTTDRRYSGSTTVRTTNAAAIALRGRYEDFATYIYDTGAAASRTDDDWYARDTVALYLQPDTDDPAAVRAGRERIRRLLSEFLPATDRAVLLTTPETDG